jgi:hypothetical protein
MRFFAMPTLQDAAALLPANDGAARLDHRTTEVRLVESRLNDNFTILVDVADLVLNPYPGASSIR